VDWQKVITEIDTLSSKINFTPDIIVGIVKGGIIPARLLAQKLQVKNMYCLTVKKENDQRKITTEICEDLNHQKILLVEDILETGKSLIIAKEYLQNKGATIKTACLYSLPISEIKPDFYLKTISKIITLPWE